MKSFLQVKSKRPVKMWSFRDWKSLRSWNNITNSPLSFLCAYSTASSAHFNNKSDIETLFTLRSCRSILRQWTTHKWNHDLYPTQTSGLISIRSFNHTCRDLWGIITIDRWNPEAFPRYFIRTSITPPSTKPQSSIGQYRHCSPLVRVSHRHPSTERRKKSLGRSF